MNPGSDAPVTVLPAALRRRSVRVVLFAIGLTLFAGALIAAFRNSSGGFVAFGSAMHRPGALAALLLLPLICLALASASFLVLTTRFGRMGALEMFALLGATWLLNYLPFKPGVAGRVAYQKAVSNIDVRWSVLIVVQGIVIGLGCFVLQAGIATIAAMLGLGELHRAGLVALPLGVALACAWVLPRSGATAHWWRYALSFAFRYADSMVWAVRYWVLFHLAGKPMGVSESAAIAGISQSASLIPLAGNGLGVREWMVGFAARTLPAWFGSGSDMPVAFGISTELLNRACEAAVAIPTGLACVWWLVGAFRRSAADRALGKDTERS